MIYNFMSYCIKGPPFLLMQGKNDFYISIVKANTLYA